MTTAAEAAAAVDAVARHAVNNVTQLDDAL